MEQALLFGEVRFDLKKQYPPQKEFEKALNKAFDAM